MAEERGKEKTPSDMDLTIQGVEENILRDSCPCCGSSFSDESKVDEQDDSNESLCPRCGELIWWGT